MFKNTKLIRKIIVLSTLVLCLGWFTMATTGEVGAAPCCSSCPGFDNPGEEQTYCEDQCGSNSGACYNQCINSVYNCYRWCSFSC